MIDPHRLLLLRTVAQAGSFAGAATLLRQTPSAVSQQISALERAAGIAVVDRSTRGVTLTEAGRLLLTAADSIHAELRGAERQLGELKEGGPGTLTVVTFPSAGQLLLAPALSTLTREPTPGERPVDVTVVEAEPPQAVEMLRAGEADLALVYHFHTRRPPREWSQTRARYTPLADDEFVLQLPSDHRLAGRSTASLADVAEERWINGWGDTGGVLDALAASHGFRPEVACRASNYRFMTALVAAGVGVALVPQLALSPNPAVRAVPLRPLQRRFIGVYLPRSPWRNQAAESLVEALQAQMAALTAPPPRGAPTPPSPSLG